MPPRLDYAAFDADNHYYEALDAFTRHMDRRLAKRAVQWAVIDGRPRLLVAEKINRFIPNPTFDPVAKAGCLDAFFRGENPEGLDIRAAFGELEPIRPAYRDRQARLDLMDQQGIEGCLLFPTLGVGIEHPLRHDAELTHATLHAFNQWLDEDWGFAWRERIFAAPLISLMDVEKAVAELEWALARDARVVHLRAAPVPGARRRSLGDPGFDPFWARVNEAGITVAFHAGESGYGEYASHWGEAEDLEAFAGGPFRSVTQTDRAIYDTMAALIVHGVFHRFPNVRVCSVENGSDWVATLLRKLKKAERMNVRAFHEPPVEAFRRHVSVAPYYEEDVAALAEAIGIENVLLGSDFPHAEGLADPLSFLDELEGLTPADVRLVMRENGLRLVQPRPASRA
ncbi:MAG TPA: amidohydrolase family protein [Myxococcota bacterium]|jgi:predicted TIM-barrel fold metal-dependent hydrolase